MPANVSADKPSRIYVWLVPSEQVLEQPGHWRIRKWDTEPFPEANYIAPSSDAPALTPPTHAEVSTYRDRFRKELDLRMDTKHPSGSPSTEAHQIALTAFVNDRNSALSASAPAFAQRSDGRSDLQTAERSNTAPAVQCPKCGAGFTAKLTPSATTPFIDPGEEYDGWAEKEKAEELLREIVQMTDNAGIQRKIKEYFQCLPAKQ